MTSPWSVALFAHNEASRIELALRSLVESADGHPLDITVLANGCTDRTAAIARDFARNCDAAHINVVEISTGDKSNAWNVYVHEVTSRQVPGTVTMHVFADGDIRVEKGALAALAAALASTPTPNAAGAMPTTGRDREAWRHRMVSRGTLAGGLYALHADFVARIRQRGIRLPGGLIGEDTLVSILAGQDLRTITDRAGQRALVVFAPDAGFAFRSLRPWRPGDQKIYLRRLWRYALRSVQFEMLFDALDWQPPETMPAHIEQLYRFGRLPSRLKWVGRTSPLRTLAVMKIRRFQRRQQQVRALGDL